jgi:phage-related protein
MGQTTWDIDYYTKGNGRCPIEDFLDDLPTQEDRVRVNRAIGRLETYGLNLDYPHVEFLRDDIWELRVRLRQVRYRLFYFIYGRERFVLLHAIMKKAGKTPDSEIDKAIEYRNDYIRQMSGRQGQ